jgi:hypothetical protein
MLPAALDFANCMQYNRDVSPCDTLSKGYRATGHAKTAERAVPQRVCADELGISGIVRLLCVQRERPPAGPFVQTALSPGFSARRVRRVRGGWPPGLLCAVSQRGKKTEVFRIVCRCPEVVTHFTRLAPMIMRAALWGMHEGVWL